MNMENVMGTNVVTQIGILVNNIDEAAQAYADLLGVEKPEIQMTATQDVSKTEYMGKATAARTKQAFFKVGSDVEIELLEPDHEPSTWRHDLDKYGEGVHHIAFKIDGMEKVVKALGQKGYKEIQKGQWNGGRYSYLDSEDKLKLVLELLEIDK